MYGRYLNLASKAFMVVCCLSGIWTLGVKSQEHFQEGLPTPFFNGLAGQLACKGPTLFRVVTTGQIRMLSLIMFLVYKQMSIKQLESRWDYETRYDVFLGLNEQIMTTIAIQVKEIIESVGQEPLQNRPNNNKRHTSCCHVCCYSKVKSIYSWRTFIGGYIDEEGYCLVKHRLNLHKYRGHSTVICPLRLTIKTW